MPHESENTQESLCLNTLDGRSVKRNLGSELRKGPEGTKRAPEGTKRAPEGTQRGVEGSAACTWGALHPITSIGHIWLPEGPRLPGLLDFFLTNLLGRGPQADFVQPTAYKATEGHNTIQLGQPLSPFKAKTPYCRIPNLHTFSMKLHHFPHFVQTFVKSNQSAKFRWWGQMTLKSLIFQ